MHVVRGCGDYAQFIMVLTFALPWPFSTREAIVYAFATDCVERGRVLVCAQSVPADAASWWGYTIPTVGSAVRMDLTLEIGFIPGGDEYQNTHMDMCLQMDPKVPWLSQSTVNLVGRLFATQLVSNVNSVCKSYSKSPYPERLAADRSGAYAVMYRCLEALRQGRLPEDEGPTEAGQQISTPE
uniref:START domain-containing protein n=1 Tax=Zooxanthella nutricula TaxID=1333877 RepID=A0A7S2I5E5_9DINO